MKKSFSLLLLTLLITCSVFAQHAVPQGMKYQAVARGLDGRLLANRQINLQVSLLSMDVAAQTFYTENQFATTNNLGLFELSIGEGKAVLGQFADVPWASKEIWIEFKMDENGTGNFKTISTTRLLAVPYAFHAATAGELRDGSTSEPLPEACTTGSVTGTLWSTASNCATSTTAKLGTADFKPIKMVTNGVERVLVSADGKVDIREDVTMDKDLSVADQTTVGRLHITGENDGAGDDFKNFSLQMDGSSQGAAIKVDGTVSGDRVFLACFDKNGLKGSISGQTQSELYNSSPYIIEHSIFALQTVAFAADIAGLVVEAAEAYALVITIPMGIAITAEVAGVTIELAEMTIEWTAWIVWQDQSVDGIVLNSADADYAEWLERADPAQDFLPGQIVGVKGGKISLETAGADHVMAISTAPIVLGNMPAKGRERFFEKVAFMGQVPVRVFGAAQVGDFILASGNADGFAVAVSPQNMKLEEYDRIVGVAWEASSNSLTSIINVAVGINSNDMADRMAEQARKVERLESQMNDLYAFLKGEKTALGNPSDWTAGNSGQSAAASFSKNTSLASLGYTEEMLAKNGSAIEAKTKEIVVQLRQSGLDVDNLPPEAKAILDNPVQALRDVQAGKYGKTFVEQLVKKQAARKHQTATGK